MTERGIPNPLAARAARGIDVACVGAPFLDLIFRGLPALPVPGEEQLADELVVVPGAIANVAFDHRHTIGMRMGAKQFDMRTLAGCKVIEHAYFITALDQRQN